MDNATTRSTAAEEDDTEVLCLMRVGKDYGWLRLFENTEVTIGRGADVTYQLLSSSCPLMISRLHCTFKQKEDGHWTVTDSKSLNGVWVNNNRIPAENPHLVLPGDSIRLGVPMIGTPVEFDYILVQRPLREIKLCLTKSQKDGVKPPQTFKKPKRKLTAEEVEPSTSSMPKLYRCSVADKSFAQPCPLRPAEPQHQDRWTLKESVTSTEFIEDETFCDVDNLHMYSQNILMLREQVDSTERQVASLEDQPRRSDPVREEQVKELQSQLETLKAKMEKMKTLEKSFNDAKGQLKEQKTQQQEEHLKKQLEEAIQEQKKVIDELYHSRKRFEEVLLAKNKELEVTKEEKKKAQAQKEEVVTQVTEVLENELQCIICSELFIEAVILNCAHAFCHHCIQLWSKKKNECPICRQAIKSQTRCLALDNCIDSMVENLSLEMKTRRQALIYERKGAAPVDVEVMVIPDEDSSRDGDSNGAVFIESSPSSVFSVNSDTDLECSPSVVVYSDDSELDD